MFDKGLAGYEAMGDSARRRAAAEAVPAAYLDILGMLG